MPSYPGDDPGTPGTESEMTLRRTAWLLIGALLVAMIAACDLLPPTETATPARSTLTQPSQAAPATLPVTPIDPTTLARPFHLPSPSGAVCPHSKARVLSPAFGPALGPGPVTPVGIGTDGVLNAPQQGKVRVQTITWVIAPAYGGPALVRGRELGKSGTVQFGTGGVATANQLRLPAGGGTTPNGAPGWRSWSVTIAVPQSGCYGFQVDGVGFSTVILFEVR